MKRFTAQLVMVFAVMLSAAMANATMATSKLETFCRSWTTDVNQGGEVGAGKTYENLSEFRAAIFCQAYITGYGSGIKGTMGADDKGIMGTYTIENGVTVSQVIKVFNQYIANHPEEENKPAGDTIYHALTNSGLLTVVVEKKSGDQ
jgi:hypothetical protein